MANYSFRMYVAGHTRRSQAAEENLRALCDFYLPGCHEIEVVDATEQPDLAEEERVLATPIVIRTSPLPGYRVIGDLSDRAKAAFLLGIPEVDGPAPEGQTL
ncbi:circadian clock KaiB family protein [Herbidospora cretacea]|uniref:circadian clock KaiB family protein n=1 Tax=Herbidospora cretacea TaxID=28444 RepID=UPI00077330BA|nr:circadian clock KaiB family protein [Herbidospora cretacea]